MPLLGWWGRATPSLGDRAELRRRLDIVPPYRIWEEEASPHAWRRRLDLGGGGARSRRRRLITGHHQRSPTRDPVGGPPREMWPNLPAVGEREWERSIGYGWGGRGRGIGGLKREGEGCQLWGIGRREVVREECLRLHLER